MSRQAMHFFGTFIDDAPWPSLTQASRNPCIKTFLSTSQCRNYPIAPVTAWAMLHHTETANHTHTHTQTELPHHCTHVLYKGLSPYQALASMSRATEHGTFTCRPALVAKGDRLCGEPCAAVLQTLLKHVTHPPCKQNVTHLDSCQKR
jgi:hypothetical protein